MISIEEVADKHHEVLPFYSWGRDIKITSMHNELRITGYFVGNYLDFIDKITSHFLGIHSDAFFRLEDSILTKTADNRICIHNQHDMANGYHDIIGRGTIKTFNTLYDPYTGYFRIVVTYDDVEDSEAPYNPADNTVQELTMEELNALLKKHGEKPVKIKE